MTTFKKKIESLILKEYENNNAEFKELNILLNKFSEEQSKELYEDLMVNQRPTYDVIFDYCYDNFCMVDL